MAENYIYDDSYDQIHHIDFDVLDSGEIEKMSALGPGPGIELAETGNGDQGPKKGGLSDARLGTSTNDTNCVTCGLNTEYCPGHFGHINLAEVVFHVGYLPFVHKILTCVCRRCSKLLVHKNEDELREILKTKSGKECMAYVRTATKNVTNCQHCAAQVSKIKIEVKKASGIISIVSEIEPDNKDEMEGKKKLRQELTPDLVYHILKNVSDVDCRSMGMIPERSRPEGMIHLTFPVPPVQMRPSAKGDFMGGASMEDDLTHKLADILKANIRIVKNKENQTENNMKFGGEHTHLLQYQIGTYLESESMSLMKDNKGKQFKSLASRLKGKTGRVRGNLMGKRGNFTARTVITSDPTIGNNQLGVPVKIAMILTFPEVVTPNNIDFLRKLVNNGMDQYPGANYVFKLSKREVGKRVLPIQLRYQKGAVELQYGDVVERHMLDNDIVLLNRQPTLHKQSMMGHRVKVINDPTLMTYRLSVAITTPRLIGCKRQFEKNSPSVFHSKYARQ